MASSEGSRTVSDGLEGVTITNPITGVAKAPTLPLDEALAMCRPESGLTEDEEEGAQQLLLKSFLFESTLGHGSSCMHGSTLHGDSSLPYFSDGVYPMQC